VFNWGASSVVQRRMDLIVVCTWPKTSTTWVQTICALVIFQTPELPAPLLELISWLDLRWVSREEVYAQLAVQSTGRSLRRTGR
jgi:aryl sulfotransferase